MGLQLNYADAATGASFPNAYARIVMGRMQQSQQLVRGDAASDQRQIAGDNRIILDVYASRAARDETVTLIDPATQQPVQVSGLKTLGQIVAYVDAAAWATIWAAAPGDAALTAAYQAVMALPAFTGATAA